MTYSKMSYAYVISCSIQRTIVVPTWLRWSYKNMAISIRLFSFNLSITRTELN